jgi:sterol desaturase/sphingolipid hydroxylase (fatty acid hydroxylase superfamily)
MSAWRTGPLHGFGLVVLLAVGLEVAWRLRAGRGYDRAAAFASLGVAAGHLAAGAAEALALAAIFQAVWRIAPVHWPLGDWRVWAAGFVAVEFAYYWFHRLSHQVRWMWTSHAVHHSAEQLTFLAAGRLGWTSLFAGGWLVYLPLVAAGFAPQLILTLLTFNLRYQFFLHTEAVGRLGPLERLFNTPAHHRVHHASNLAYRDRNFGGMLIVFDRLFGTFAAERTDTPIRYGLVRPLRSTNPFRLALAETLALGAELRRAPSLRAGIRIALARP